jgi:histidine triad (HIT) family protein
VNRCVFCRIVAGEEPADVVFADEVAAAFLDHSPLFPGHTLVVPIAHHETLGDLPGHLVEPYFARVQRLSVLMESALGAEGSFVASNQRVSQSVPHFHTHVVPRTKGDGLRGFFWPRTKYESAGHAASVAATLAEAWHAG